MIVSGWLKQSLSSFQILVIDRFHLNRVTFNVVFIHEKIRHDVDPLSIQQINLIVVLSVQTF